MHTHQLEIRRRGSPAVEEISGCKRAHAILIKEVEMVKQQIVAVLARAVHKVVEEIPLRSLVPILHRV